MGYFESARADFQLSANWREPQIGAIAALLSHWTLRGDEPALISLPTGAGKTGVALAAPFVMTVPSRRVLVMVSSRCALRGVCPRRDG